VNINGRRKISFKCVSQFLKWRCVAFRMTYEDGKSLFAQRFGCGFVVRQGPCISPAVANDHHVRLGESEHPTDNIPGSEITHRLSGSGQAERQPLIEVLDECPGRHTAKQRLKIHVREPEFRGLGRDG
jgi:hypothetical protein